MSIPLAGPTQITALGLQLACDLNRDNSPTSPAQEILSACWSFDLRERPSFTVLMEMLEKLPKLNRRLSHPGHFWKSAE